MASDGDAYAPGVVKWSDSAKLGFELVSSTPAPPALGDNAFVMAVHDPAGERLSGALGVTLDMPQHGHSSPKQPKIVFDATTGAFSLAPMRLFMVGLWQLTFSFQPDESSREPSASAPASAVFTFCVE